MRQTHPSSTSSMTINIKTDSRDLQKKIDIACCIWLLSLSFSEQHYPHHTHTHAHAHTFMHVHTLWRGLMRPICAAVDWLWMQLERETRRGRGGWHAALSSSCCRWELCHLLTDRPQRCQLNLFVVQKDSSTYPFLQLQTPSVNTVMLCALGGMSENRRQLLLSLLVIRVDSQ